MVAEYRKENADRSKFGDLIRNLRQRWRCKAMARIDTEDGDLEYKDFS